MAKKTRKTEPDTTAVDGAEDETSTGGRRRKLLIPLVVVVVVLAAGGAYASGLVGGADAAAAGTPTPTPPPELGPITELESITVNLADGHYLKVGLALELSPDAPAEELAVAPAYDEAIALFSGRTMADLGTPEQRTAAKDQLLAQITTVYGPDVAGLYFTEFVMQ